MSMPTSAILYRLGLLITSRSHGRRPPLAVRPSHWQSRNCSLRNSRKRSQTTLGVQQQQLSHQRVVPHTALGISRPVSASKHRPNATQPTVHNVNGLSQCRYILKDTRTVRPISFYQPELGCCLSMPAVLGRTGIIRPMPIELDETERKDLESCAANLRNVIEGAEAELAADRELEKALATDKGA